MSHQVPRSSQALRSAGYSARQDATLDSSGLPSRIMSAEGQQMPYSKSTYFPRKANEFKKHSLSILKDARYLYMGYHFRTGHKEYEYLGEYA